MCSTHICPFCTESWSITWSLSSMAHWKSSYIARSSGRWKYHFCCRVGKVWAPHAFPQVVTQLIAGKILGWMHLDLFLLLEIYFYYWKKEEWKKCCKNIQAHYLGVIFTGDTSGWMYSYLLLNRWGGLPPHTWRLLEKRKSNWKGFGQFPALCSSVI